MQTDLLVKINELNITIEELKQGVIFFIDIQTLFYTTTSRSTLEDRMKKNFFYELKFK